MVGRETDEPGRPIGRSTRRPIQESLFGACTHWSTKFDGRLNLFPQAFALMTDQ
jgi:hypothetical protein